MMCSAMLAAIGHALGLRRSRAWALTAYCFVIGRRKLAAPRFAGSHAAAVRQFADGRRLHGRRQRSTLRGVVAAELDSIRRRRRARRQAARRH